ncbi:hypothetical protein MJ585_08500 [Klebsiella pneumoniae]|nr:hypothetical protein MJ585_08500 [Klebsiella pneumoniae]
MRKSSLSTASARLNRNGLLWDNSLNVDGIKTGHTDKAGYNLRRLRHRRCDALDPAAGRRDTKGRESESKTAYSGLPLLRNRQPD